MKIESLTLSFVRIWDESACDESGNTYVHIHLVGFRLNHFIKTYILISYWKQINLLTLFILSFLIANILQLLYVCLFVFLITKSLTMVKAVQLLVRTTCNSLLDRSSIWQIYNECSFTKWKSMLSNESPFFPTFCSFRMFFFQCSKNFMYHHDTWLYLLKYTNTRKQNFIPVGNSLTCPNHFAFTAIFIPDV